MNKDDVLQVAKECGMYEFPPGQWTTYGNISSVETETLERFAAAMYAKSAADMKERATGICRRFGDRGMHPHECEGAIRALPITPTNTEGEQNGR